MLGVNYSGHVVFNKEVVKPVDTRCNPGDIVTVRGVRPIKLFTFDGNDTNSATSTGMASPGSLGIVISARPPNHPNLSYVIFSSPHSLGWVNDGELRKLWTTRDLKATK